MHILLLHLFADRLAPAFCGMLLHSLWQGILLGLCVAVTRLLTKKWNAASRYNLSITIFTGFLCVCVFTFLWEFMHADRHAFAAENTAIQVVPDLFADWYAAHQQTILLVWLVFFAAKIIHMWGALWFNQQIRHRQVNTPDIYWQETFQRLCAALNINKAVKLLESGYMKIPVVTGHIKPVVLLPLGLLSALPADQVEAILLHELAHIRRNDWLINYFQHMAECIFFFHPVVLLVSSVIREEREHCCDDIAIGQTNNRQGLAAALIHFKEQALYGIHYRTAFPGKKNQLLRRVQHIISQRGSKPGHCGWLFFLAAFFVLFAGSAVLMLVTGRKNSGKNFGPVVAISTAAVKHIQTVATIKDAVIKKIPSPNKKIFLQPAVSPIKAFTEKTAPLLTEKEIAEKDMEQSHNDEVVAKSDQEKARQDQQQARLDQEQAFKDQAEAMKDQEQASLDQQKAVQDQQQALIRKKEAERMRLKIQPAI